MNKLTYFPLIIDRWISGTRHMNFEEKGMYISVLVYIYETRKDILEADLPKILGCNPRTFRKIWPRIRAKFSVNSGRIRHQLAHELIKNGGKIRGLQGIAFPTDPDPDPEERNTPLTGSTKKELSTGSRLPEDWAPDPKETMWASQEFSAVNLTLETEKFRDYWLGVPGQRGRKTSWPRTWRNWIRKAAELKTTKPNGSDYDKPIRGSFEWQTERARERLERIEASEVLGSDETPVRQALGTGTRTRN